ncbi:hypothetical protein ULMS_29480 [Patiriisocius marinistellae]|uniref:Uncharacterized protein n=1 Tax=Patiriisocius marinistellae TaxID=2494560 RepID=A0A5J4FYS2_9FLAO|nr:hypothetical protein [Patiriisocius marinistellae]GEQ87440.1 hypothetical protein ULMS_29480 [Patiriisocius marinistellae]
MTTTLDKIQKEVIKSYTKSLSREETIDNLLDKINDRKRTYKEFADGINKLGKLVRKITWLDDLSDSDEVMIRGLIAMGKASDLKYRKFLAEDRRLFVPKGLFKEDFKYLREAIENHKESVFEVEQIIFEFRQDEDFKELCKVIDDF